jgi:hypothetical protein
MTYLFCQELPPQLAWVHARHSEWMKKFCVSTSLCGVLTAVDVIADIDDFFYVHVVTLAISLLHLRTSLKSSSLVFCCTVVFETLVWPA